MEIMITNPDGVKLKTTNKYCSEDINVYPILQEKTATINNTDITIDQGYAGLSVVHVAVPESGGGAELNITYGDTPPTDTSKLWIKSTPPSNIEFSRNPEQQVQELAVLDKYLQPAAVAIAAAAVGKKIYLFGGYGGGKYLDTILEFDTETKKIKDLAEEDPTIKLPKSASNIAAAAADKKIYLFGGYDGGKYFDTILEFDTETKKIKDLAEEDPTIKLPTAAKGMAAAAVGTKIYLFGGSTSAAIYLDTILEFDTDEKTIGEIVAASTGMIQVTNMAAAAVGTKIYLFGGYGGDGKGDYLDTILEFDTERKRISILSVGILTAAQFVTAVAVGVKIYLFGGGYRSDYLKTIQEFDTDGKTITTLSETLQNNAYDMAAAAVGTKIYLFGGYNAGGWLNIIQEFIVNFPLMANNILVQQDYNTNIFTIVPSPTKVTIGVKNVYKGNASNIADFVDAYLHNGTNWVNINTEEIYTIGSD